MKEIFSMIKLVIFDLDGTLINSIMDLADATNYALRECGFTEHPVAKYNYFVGDGVNNLILRAIPEGSRCDAIILKVKNLFSEYYNKHYSDKTYIYEGIIPLLNNLKKKGLKLAVATNKPDQFAKEIITNLFGIGIFDFVQGHKEGIPHKPDPRIIKEAMSFLAVSDKETVMIGDTNVDIKTGKNAGIRTIGCLWGFRDELELKEAGADYIVSNPNEIIDILM